MDDTNLPLRDIAQLVFELCLRRPEGASEGEIAQSLDVAEGDVQNTVDELVGLGLVRKDGDAVKVLPPRSAFSQAAGRLEEMAERTRQQGMEWQALWTRCLAGNRYVDVLTDPEEAAHAQRVFIDNVRTEVRTLEVGPVGPRHLRPPPQVHVGTFEAMDRGVGFRVVYGAEIFSDPRGLAIIEACVARGEEARVFAEIPVTVALADDTIGIVSVPGSGDVRKHIVVVHPSGLLDSLNGLFDCFWRMGVPLTGAGSGAADDEPDDASRQLLTYLAGGLTDDAIARTLEVSERTVGRRIAVLQERLGARSRFQLAALAARRGWI